MISSQPLMAVTQCCLSDLRGRKRSRFFLELTLNFIHSHEKWKIFCFSILKATLWRWSPCGPWNVHWSHDLRGTTGPRLSVTCGGVRERRMGRGPGWVIATAAVGRRGVNGADLVSEPASHCGGRGSCVGKELITLHPASVAQATSLLPLEIRVSLNVRGF